jgi:hypothetical protein
MKTKLFFLCFLIFQLTDAQNITFSDPVLKDFLLIAPINFNQDVNNYITYPPIDANSDGEISMTEALNVIGLDLYYLNITNLEGLQYFTNLKVISTYYANFPNFNLPTLVNLKQLSLLNSVGYSSLTSVDVSNNTNLVKLQCSSDLITSLDLSNNTLLQTVDIYCPSLTAVNFSNLVNLKSLSYLGKMPTIDISDAVNLLNLNCVGSSGSFSYPLENRLTSIDLTNQTKLITLDLTGNTLSTLDLSTCPNLERISISNNLLSTLNITNVSYVKNFFCEENLLSDLSVDAMFNLNNFSCKNNQLTTLSTKNGIIEEYIDFSGNPNLNSICCDANEVVYVQNQCFLNNNDTVVVNSNCGASSKIAMYPNPVKDMLHLKSSISISKVEIYSTSGLLVMKDESQTDVIDMNVLKSGMYFIRVYSSDGVAVMKCVKQ